MMQLECVAALHDHENKEKLWNIYVKGEQTNRQFYHSSKYFYNLDDENQCIAYGDKFFQEVEKIFESKYRDYAATFFHHLAPTFLGREVYLDHYLDILTRAAKTENTHFIKLLKEEIEKLETIIRVRALQSFAM